MIHLVNRRRQQQGAIVQKCRNPTGPAVSTDPGYPNFLIKNVNGNHCGPLVNLFFFKIYYQWVPVVTNGRITNHY